MSKKRPILEIPGPKAREVIARDKKYGATTTVDFPLVVKRGDGVWLTTIDDQRVLDATSGVGVSNLGFGNTDLTRAIVDELENRIGQFIANDFPGITPSLLKEKLSNLVRVARPRDGVAKTFLANDGAGANEAAIKLLMHNNPEKDWFISFVGAFHGRSGYTLPVMGSKSIHTRDFPMAYSVLHLPFPEQGKTSHYASQTIAWEHCIDAYIEHECFGRYIDPKKVMGIILELVQGEGGVCPISPDGLRRIVKISRKYDIPIINDEVQTGFGRTGKLFAYEHFDFFTPDIVTMAKSFTELLPGGAAVFGEHLDFKEKGVHSGTFQGNALACRAALEVIAAFGDGSLLRHVANMSEMLKVLAIRFMASANNRREIVRQVRGLGLMYGIEFSDVEFRDEILHQSLIRGLNLIGAGHPREDPTIRILPPLIIQESELTEMFAIMKEAFEATVHILK